MKARRMLAVPAVLATAAALLVWAGSAFAAPGATLVPAVLAPTQTITVGGSGFAANETVDIYFDTADLALASTDASGNFTGFPISVPAAAIPGNHWVTLVGRHDGLSVQKLVTVHTGWVQQGWSAFRRSLNPFENILSATSVGGLEEDWTFPSAQVSHAGPVVPSGSRQAIIGDQNGVVRAISLVTGAVVWTRNLGGHVEATAAVDSGRVYVTNDDGNLYALNATTGAIVWQTPVTSHSWSAPAVLSNVVYVGGYDDFNLYAINGSTGAVIWKGPTGGHIYGSPAVSGGRVFVGSDDGSVYAFAVGCATGGANCSPLWSTSVGGSVTSTPAVSNGVVYAGSNNHNLYAFNATTGVVLWSGDLGAGVNTNSPAVANGMVFSASISGVLSAFPAACGTGGGVCSPTWQSAATGTFDSTPGVANGVVYVSGAASANGRVAAFPAGACSNPCSPLWTGTISGNATSPAIADGMVLAGYSGATAGGLVAWDLPAASHAPVVRPDPKTLKPDPSLRPSR